MNVSDFRKNLKDCFDRAANGEIIEVERGGLFFILQKKSPVATPQIFIDEATTMTQEQINAIANLKVDAPKAVFIGTNPATTNEFASAVEAGKSSGERACCAMKKPCQHWAWQDSGIYINTLSGREMEAEL